MGSTQYNILDHNNAISGKSKSKASKIKIKAMGQCCINERRTSMTRYHFMTCNKNGHRFFKSLLNFNGLLLSDVEIR